MAYVTTRAPCGTRRSMHNGHDLFRMFHRYHADRVMRMAVHRVMPDVLVQLGRLKAVIYTSDKGRPGQKPLTYIHFMESQPWLTCDANGRQLYIVGGRYRVTARGIEG